jgi:O-antigen/teichoic acid export membrane protein
MVGGFLLPALAAAAAKGERHRVAYLYHWTSRWSLVACVPVLSILVLEPHATLDLFFGIGFGHIALPLRILGLGALCHVMFGFNGYTLEAQGVALPTAFRSGVGILLSAVLCVALVPTYGATGAALATTIAIVVVNLLCSALLLTRFEIAPWDRHFAIVVASLVPAGALAALAASEVSGAFTRCAVAAAVTTVIAVAAAIVVSWTDLGGEAPVAGTA